MVRYRTRLAWDVLPPQLTVSAFFRYTLLEALRVASVWRHGGTSSGATPVLPYARLAYTHTVAFLNKVWSVKGCTRTHLVAF